MAIEKIDQRTRSVADLLREQISAAQQNSTLRMMAPALPKLLGILDAYIVKTESRLDALERACAGKPAQ